MRKLVGVLLIAVCVGGGIWMSLERMNQPSGDSDKQVTQNEASKSVEAKIDEIDKKIENNYPEKVKEIVEIHNELMAIAYKYPMNEEEVKKYVSTVRKLYSLEFLEINPEAAQIEALDKERQSMSEENMELIASNIDEVYIAQDNEGEEVSAEVNVLHVTNQGSLERTYLLIKEEGLWKINGWETAKPQENEETKKNEETN